MERRGGCRRWHERKGQRYDMSSNHIAWDVGTGPERRTNSVSMRSPSIWMSWFMTSEFRFAARLKRKEAEFLEMGRGNGTWRVEYVAWTAQRPRVLGVVSSGLFHIFLIIIFVSCRVVVDVPRTFTDSGSYFFFHFSPLFTPPLLFFIFLYRIPRPFLG